ncbi:hypothetical protein PIB30_052424 [Stylosanthes scabra]|uniref:RNase H type-1 domain-containing protein n=1 Tax=Stylosanthes scabra TaxID=79078 RepID=A0ABU6TIQ2_9FABA|nr:hypothetical protein [Stylosanthes scabra]
MAINMARNLEMENIIFESDNRDLTIALKNRVLLAEADPILQDILEAQNHFKNAVFLWNPREGNKLAHELAKMRFEECLRADWRFNLPHNIRDIVLKERKSNH